MAKLLILSLMEPENFQQLSLMIFGSNIIGLELAETHDFEGLAFLKSKIKGQILK